MLSLIVDKNNPEDIDILLDSNGIDELISYLEYIKKEKDHMHLTIDTELDNFPISKDVQHTVICAKYVRLQYEDTKG